VLTEERTAIRSNLKTNLCVFQSNSLGVEEFQRALQAAFNFPLRPFVLPFLRAGIPAMQREVAALARIAKMVRFQFSFFFLHSNI
jgi:NHR1 homology to TAF